MRKILGAAALAAAALVAVAPSASAQSLSDAEFFGLLQQKNTSWGALPNTADMISAIGDGARDLCTSLDSSASKGTLNAWIGGFQGEMTEYLSLEDVGFYAGAAIMNYCPKHENLTR
ncbi:DUF732 domain-containing protein [Nocardia yamanashiensis]|uniref:DUF732 domain-containing protein n=1 Tax=Nocardia yamanashiensis TaxID=209247 RepID=UPI00082E8767|nr:DUF732 domain-containing protein [Nocardia yamanashiensis]UGT42928.1 DUF732 domain-containing protein [Nocardia yamanashiensis]